MFEYDQNWDKIGFELYDFMKELFPICRSITGNGVRKTLNIIKKHIPLDIIEVPTGKEVFDWTIPKEWNIKDAYIKNSKGEKIVDFKESNLHVVNYSTPIKKKLSLKELRKHLFSLPEYPDWIPYFTSYYEEFWGFCLTHRVFEQLKDDLYEVYIDSTLKDGHLTYGELFLEGKDEDEFLLTCYICHPSLCNDNLSGVVLLTFLAKYLIKLSEEKKLKLSYRFLFIPETIGSITWLSLNKKKISKIKYGLVATCLADSGKSTYKKTRIGNSIIDIDAKKVLDDSKEPYEIIDFFPSGSDERQFSSPGFNLPVGSLMRTMYGRFPQYHTSGDNLDFVKPEYLENSIKKYLNIIFILENNIKYLNLNPECEPQLGKRGLYETISKGKKTEINQLAVFWVLNLSDGNNSLLDISVRSKINFGVIKRSADLLVNNGLLREI